MAETVREAGGDDPWVVASWYEGSVVVRGLGLGTRARSRTLERQGVRSRAFGRKSGRSEGRVSQIPTVGALRRSRPPALPRQPLGGRPLVMPPLVPLALLGFYQG